MRKHKVLYLVITMVTATAVFTACSSNDPKIEVKELAVDETIEVEVVSVKEENTIEREPMTEEVTEKSNELEVFVGVEVLNVRKEPSKNAEKIGTVHTTQSFIVTGEEYDENGVIWYLVEYSPGTMGWIISQYCFTEDEVIEKLKSEMWVWDDEGDFWISEFSEEQILLYIYCSDFYETYDYDRVEITREGNVFKVTFHVFKTVTSSIDGDIVYTDLTTYTILYYGNYLELLRDDGRKFKFELSEENYPKLLI